MITLIDLYIFNIIFSLIFISKKDKVRFLIHFSLSLLLPYIYVLILVVPKWISKAFKLSILNDEDFLDVIDEYSHQSMDKLEHDMIVPYLDIVYFGSVKEKREYLKNVSVNHDNILQVIKIVMAFINDTDSEVKLYASSALSGVKMILPGKLQEMMDSELTEEEMLKQFNILVTLFENEIYDADSYDMILYLLNRVMDQMVASKVFEYHIDVVQFCMKYMPSKIESYLTCPYFTEEQQDYILLDYAFYAGDNNVSRKIIQKYKNKVIQNERLNDILGVFGG